MIALIDYGAGNLTSVRKALAAAGAEFLTPTSPGELAGAEGIVVPGVGHFSATASLAVSWTEAIRARVGQGCPLLGICLGMQWLFEGSSEAPGVPGLGLLDGRCERLDDRGGTLKVPHVGWNALELTRPSWLLSGVASGAYVYFTHSFAAPVTHATVAAATHGTRFAAAVEQEHVAGVQFHPEKSAEAGLQMIRNFLARCRQQPAPIGW
jgi:glutamine amidotransferase